MSEYRRLSTILFADLTGYTAMMQKDEQHALELLNLFKQILYATMPAHFGEIVQYSGDASLLSFDSATNGVNCAYTLQKTFIEREFPVRIGMHLGDVDFKNNNTLGDGVNIDSRIESIGITASIIVSKAIRDNVRNKDNYQMVSLGSMDFKKVDEPIEVLG